MNLENKESRFEKLNDKYYVSAIVAGCLTVVASVWLVSTAVINIIKIICG